MVVQVKGFFEGSFVLMVGLDFKVIIEYKEKEKMMMFNKKVIGIELYYMNYFIMLRLLYLVEVIGLVFL